MFKIRAEQMSQLSQNSLQRFVQQMTRELQADFTPHLQRQNITADKVSDFVRQAVKDAARYGVIGDADVRLYIHCLLLLNTKFDVDSQWPWAGEILRQTNLSGTPKMDQVHDYLLFTCQQQI